MESEPRLLHVDLFCSTPSSNLKSINWTLSPSPLNHSLSSFVKAGHRAFPQHLSMYPSIGFMHVFCVACHFFQARWCSVQGNRSAAFGLLPNVFFASSLIVSRRVILCWESSTRAGYVNVYFLSFIHLVTTLTSQGTLLPSINRLECVRASV